MHLRELGCLTTLSKIWHFYTTDSRGLDGYPFCPVLVYYVNQTTEVCEHSHGAPGECGFWLWLLKKYMELQKNDYSSVLTEVKGEEYDGGALAAFERVKSHRVWERAGECRLTSLAVSLQSLCFFILLTVPNVDN